MGLTAVIPWMPALELAVVVVQDKLTATSLGIRHSLGSLVINAVYQQTAFVFLCD